MTICAYTHLKLDKQLRECIVHLAHEFLHEFGHLLVRYALLAEAEVERIIEELLVVRSQVKTDGNRRRRADALRRNK